MRRPVLSGLHLVALTAAVLVGVTLGPVSGLVIAAVGAVVASRYTDLR